MNQHPVARFVRGRRATPLWAAVCAALLAACSAQHSGPPRRSVGQIKSDIGAVRLSDPKTLRALDGDAHDPNAATAARQALAARPSGDAAWGAAYVYLDAGTDPAPLAGLLTDTHPDVRALAAAGSVLDGSPAGFPVLIDLLGRTEIMRGSEPPVTLGQFAGVTLVRATGDTGRGPTDGASEEQLTAAQARWRAWWSASGAALRWNAADRVWGAA